ncbi:S8 family serine peptidase [Halobacillus litoralis]|uniref:S8 family serine peptidase n=1 Tax=Halobacillus litoralis TaxID=45668 RepID=UPI00273E05C8|nr:S8 family serine peptidase [Halobacillus litoralis]WLR49024.1 S8 family serine peptidase [Halobacillus litoralis]
MKEWVKVCLVAFLVVVVTPALVSASSEKDDPKRVILTYEKDEGLAFLDEIPHTIHHHYERLGAAAVTVSESDLPLLENAEAVTSIEEDQRVKVSAQQEGWGYTSIGTQKSDNLGLTGEGVKVAVIDTGINTNHPDLKVTGGASFVEDETFVDDNGHGTHVAGIIGALDNDEGTIGIAPKAQLYAVKVLDQDGNGLVSSVLAGIEWAIEEEMDMINLSLTACTPSDLTKQALQGAKDAGIIVVAASGNKDVCTYDDVTDVLYPARYPGDCKCWSGRRGPIRFGLYLWRAIA